MTGKKANAVEVRTAGIGDNSGVLDLIAPDDYAHHYKSIKGLEDRAATANSAVRHAKEAANKCFKGLGASISQTIRLEREGDTDKLKRHLELMSMGLHHIGSTVQLSIFDSLAGDNLDQVYKRFYKDGQTGKSLDSKYPEGSDLAAQAARAWRHGMAFNMGQSPEAADAAVADDMTDVERRLPPPPVMDAPAAVTQH